MASEKQALTRALVVGVLLGVALAFGAVALFRPPRCAFAGASCVVGASAVFTQNVGIQGSSGSVVTLTASPTADRTITFPDAAGTVVLLEPQQTISNKTLGPGWNLNGQTISGNATFAGVITYSAAGNALRVDHNVVVGGNLLLEGETADILTLTSSPTLNRTITFPDADGTVVLTDASQTVSNKTLGTGWDLNGQTIAGAATFTGALTLSASPTGLTVTNGASIAGHSITSTDLAFGQGVIISTPTDAGMTIKAQGTGSIILATANYQRWKVDSNGHLLAVTDNVVDIGASTGNRPRNIYLAGNLQAVGKIGVGVVPTARIHVRVDNSQDIPLQVDANVGGTVETVLKVQEGSGKVIAKYGLFPNADNTGSVGESTLRWSLVRAVTITSGDLGWEETVDHLTGSPFVQGDLLVMVVKRMEHGTTYTVPVLLDTALERSSKFREMRQRIESLEREADRLEVMLECLRNGGSSC